MEPTKEVEALGNQVWWGASTHLELKGQGENGVSTAMGAGDLVPPIGRTLRKHGPGAGVWRGPGQARDGSWSGTGRVRR